MLQSTADTGVLNINCCDPLGRSALLMAIDNENLEMVDLLLENKVGKFIFVHFFEKVVSKTFPGPHFGFFAFLNLCKICHFRFSSMCQCGTTQL